MFVQVLYSHQMYLAGFNLVCEICVALFGKLITCRHCYWIFLYVIWQKFAIQIEILVAVWLKWGGFCDVNPAELNTGTWVRGLYLTPISNEVPLTFSFPDGYTVASVKKIWHISKITNNLKRSISWSTCPPPFLSCLNFSSIARLMYSLFCVGVRWGLGGCVGVCVRG